MKEVYLLLGSNLGDRLVIFYQARILIEKHVGHISACSNIFESEAWGYHSENQFLNQALRVETNLSPTALLQAVQNIELQLGRLKKTTSRYEDRVIDIDILLYGQELINQENPSLQIPHPQLANRAFALEPLCEILPPRFLHPGLGVEMRGLLKNSIS